MMWIPISKEPDFLDTSKCYVVLDRDGRCYLAKKFLSAWGIYSKSKGFSVKADEMGLDLVKYRVATQTDIDKLKRFAIG